MNNSKWIWLNKDVNKNEYVEFLTTVDYKSGTSTMKISVDTEYALFVNDKYVASGQYADFPWYKVYNVIDLTGVLVNGKNEIKILVWYMGDPNLCHYVNRPGLKFEIFVNDKMESSSGEEVLCRPCPYLVSGEDIKKITVQLGYSFLWQESEPSEWKNAVEVLGLPEKLIERPISNLEILEKSPAKAVSPCVYDLGAETVGYPYLEIKASVGERVNISFGEWLDDDGCVRRIMNNGKYDFSFEVEGCGYYISVFNPLRKLGCRYFQISGNCEVREIGVYPLRYPFEKREVGLTSHRRRKIYDLSVRTLELCAFEHYWDCPWREQAMWTLDAMLQMRYGYSAFYGSNYQKAMLLLIAEDRRSDGLLTKVVPSSTNNTIPSFSFFYIVAIAEYLEKSSDFVTVEKCFAKAKNVMDTFIDRIEEGLIPCFEGQWNFYEWKPKFFKVTEKFDAVLNLIAAYALHKLVYVCEKLRKVKDYTYYSKVLKNLSAAIRNRYFDKDIGLFKSFDDDAAYSQLANSLAILSEVASDREAERICEIIIEGGIEMTETTLSMTSLKYDALLKVSKEKYKDFILSDIDNVFGNMLDADATSLWETSLGKDDMDGTGSLCHGWSALPVYYYSQLEGVKVD